MNYWKWQQQFKPVPNHFDKTAGIDGCLFQPYGKEWEFVSAINPKYVWSLIVTDAEEGDGSYWEIANGVHVINREGYLVTEKSCTDQVSVEY